MATESYNLRIMKSSDTAGKKVCLVLSTCSPSDAERLAKFLVGNGHAACVNIVPQVTSIYRWEGKLENDVESLLVIKCAKDGVEALTQALVKEHPYDVPELIAFEVGGGNPAYLEWVLANTGI